MDLYFDELDSRGLSPRLWDGIDFNNLLKGTDSRRGVAVFDDFVGFGGVLSTNTGNYSSRRGRWISYQTASTLLTNVALTPTPASVSPTSMGAIVLQPTSGVADGDQISLQWGGHELTPYGTFPFAAIPAISGDLVFECRYKVSSIAANIGNWFIGLAGAAGVAPVASAVPLTSSDAFVTTLSLLGFGKLAADDSDIDLFYERASGTVAAKDTTAVNVADTYMKAGFRYHSLTKTVSVYIDGVEKKDAALSKAITAATPWPNDYMAPVICTMQTDGTTAMNLTVDWIAVAQLPPIA